MVNTKVPRGINTNFICLYLAKHGPCRAKQVLVALAQYRGKWLHTKTGGHNGVDYFYRNHCGHSPVRGLRFGGVYTPRPPFNHNTSQCPPYWCQLSKRGPWALTLLGWSHVAKLIAAGESL